MSWCVYILKGNRYYVGSTNNIQRRIAEHQTKGYSSKRIGERVLIKTIPCQSKEDARSLEREIKKSGHIERYVSIP